MLPSTSSDQDPIAASLPVPTSDQATRTDAVIHQLETAVTATFALLRELRAARSDGDEWTRLPRKKDRCPVSKFSRSKIERLIKQDLIRGKSVEGAAYYALSDIRSLLRNSAALN